MFSLSAPKGRDDAVEAIMQERDKFTRDKFLGLLETFETAYNFVDHEYIEDLQEYYRTNVVRFTPNINKDLAESVLAIGEVFYRAEGRVKSAMELLDSEDAEFYCPYEMMDDILTSLEKMPYRLKHLKDMSSIKKQKNNLEMDYVDKLVMDMVIMHNHMCITHQKYREVNDKYDTLLEKYNELKKGQ